jgi:hypothetical protein
MDDAKPLRHILFELCSQVRKDPIPRDDDDDGDDNDDNNDDDDDDDDDDDALKPRTRSILVPIVADTATHLLVLGGERAGDARHGAGAAAGADVGMIRPAKTPTSLTQLPPPLAQASHLTCSAAAASFVTSIIADKTDISCQVGNALVTPDMAMGLLRTLTEGVGDEDQPRLEGAFADAFAVAYPNVSCCVLLMLMMMMNDDDDDKAAARGRLRGCFRCRLPECERALTIVVSYNGALCVP